MWLQALCLHLRVICAPFYECGNGWLAGLLYLQACDMLATLLDDDLDEGDSEEEEEEEQEEEARPHKPHK